MKAAQAAKANAIARLRNAIAELTRIAADQLGITAAWGCFTSGDLGDCAETAVNVLLSATGELATKIVGKYLFRIGEGIKLGKQIAKLAKDVIKDFREWRSESKALKLLQKCDSFAAGTLVLANGTAKPIEKIKVGDKITNAPPGADPGSHDQTHTVTAIHITRTDRDYTNVTIATPKGPQTITGTSHHLYWDTTTRAWTRADHLHAGDQLQTTAGHHATITALHSYTASMVTYNLTIDHLHTYYVEAGTTPVLVHNADEGRICDLTLGPALRGQKAEGIAAERGDKVLPHEQEFINESGDRNGCAACHARTSGWPDGHWTGDHNPANKLFPSGPWTLYPHCMVCSRTQGGIVNGLRKEYKSYDSFPIVP
jgi:hypothetical protein